MYKTFLLVALCALWGSMSAQIPAGYYDAASGLNGTALKSALHDIIDDHNEINYEAVKFALQVLDEDPENSDNILLIYKGISIPKSDFDIGNDGWNREHLWPQSHGDFGTNNGPGTDVHVLRPADVTVNTSRGNKDFDNGGEPHYEAIGCYTDTDSWEVRDAVKGDVARAIFYMCTRYEGDVVDEPDLEILDEVTESSSDGFGYLGVLTALLEWNEFDPVDASEIARNNAIYSNYQNNRNPFIDHPEFADLIWNDELLPEPTNHASDFSAHTITLQWIDAIGDVLPEAYLVRMSDIGFDNILSPTDGINIENDFWNKNVSYGAGRCVFGSLTPGTMYYFKIFGYSGNGTATDYKTGEGVMQVNIEAN